MLVRLVNEASAWKYEAQANYDYFQCIVQSAVEHWQGGHALRITSTGKQNRTRRGIIWYLVNKYENEARRNCLMISWVASGIGVAIYLQFIANSILMSKDESDSHLRYGQGILLCGYKNEYDHLQGSLTVKGFADTRANYELIGDILYFKNYRNAIFEFLPAGNFEINDQLHKLAEKVVNSDEEELKRKQIIETLSLRAKSQKNQFELTTKAKKKETIKFGDCIILRHIDSSTYLSGTIRPSNGSNGAFSVEVSRKLSRFLIFQIMPYRSFESESMEIPFSSPVLLRNVVNNGYLTFEKVGRSEGSSKIYKYLQKMPTASDQSYRIPVKTESSVSYEAVTHFVDLSIEEEVIPMPWIFQLHFKDVENDSLVQHDIVYLQHTENNGILSALQQEIILKQSKEQIGDGLSFYQSLWEIEKHDKTANSYILRHLMSGMTLGIENSRSQEPQTPILIEIDEQEKQIGVIELKLAKKTKQVINSNSYINICWGDFILDTVEESNEDEIEMLRSRVGEGELINTRKMKKMAQKEADFRIRKLKFTENISKHCFVIQEINDDLKKQLLFALSFHSTIIRLREDLKWGANESAKRISYKQMMKVTQKIREIIDFLKECEPDSPDKQFIVPSTKRQMICKDLGLSELLFELLFYMHENMNENVFKDKANEHEKFKEMYETIYEVIINLIKNNRLFKIHVSKWIIFIFEDVINNNNEIYFKTLMQLLKDNNFFVENFVSEELVRYLFEQTLKGKQQSSEYYEKKYLEIMRSFCLCGSTILSKNQAIILHHFIEKLEATPEGEFYQLRFKPRQKENGQNLVYCYASIDKQKVLEFEFHEFVEKCLSRNQNGTRVFSLSWEYNTAYLNLLADLAQGRNKAVQNFIKKEMPLQVLTQLFENYELREFEVPIIKIVHYLYSQNENFYPIERHNQIVNYQLIEQDVPLQVNHFDGQVSPWDSLERFLNRLVAKLEEAGPILPAEVHKNQVLSSMLAMTRQTLLLGFWKTKESLETIYSNVRKILQPHPDIDYDKAKQIKDQNKLMIACKIECLNIIDLIIDQDIHMELQLLNRLFKSFRFPESAANFNLEVVKLLEEPEDTEFAKQFLEQFRRESKAYTKIVKFDIYEQLLELAKYGNAELTKQSLRIFQLIFEKERIELQRFYKNLFIVDDDRIEFSNYLTKLRNKFYTLEDSNTPFVTLESQENYYFPIYDEQRGIMQNLYTIDELMKNENSLGNIRQISTLDSSNAYQRLSTDQLINFTNERKSSNLSKQKLVGATNIHKKLLTFILNCQSVPESELASKLLHLCYKFMVGLIENNQEAKMEMIQYLPHMMKHLSHNIGCIDFLKEIYDNNKTILYNESEISQLIRRICEIIESQDNTFYKSKLLDFMRYLIYLNNKPIENNQILILKIMQDDDFHNINVKPTKEYIEQLIEQYHQDNGYNFEFPRGLVVTSPELTYLTTYFQILTSLVDEANKVNSGKLERRFPFTLLCDLLSASGSCYYLRRNIRVFLNRLYYFEVGTNAYLNQILNDEIPGLARQIDDLNHLKFQENVTVFNIRFENPVRFSYLKTYHYLHLEEIMFTIYSILNTAELFTAIVKYLKTSDASSIQTCYNLMKIGERLGWTSKYFKKKNNVYTTSIIKFLQSRLNLILQELPFEIYKPMLRLSSTPPYSRIQSLKASAIASIFQGNITELYSQKLYLQEAAEPYSFTVGLQGHALQSTTKKTDWSTLRMKLIEIFTRKKREFESEDEQINFRMDKIVSGLKRAKGVKQRIYIRFRDNLFNNCQSEDELLEFIQTIIEISTEDSQLFEEHLKIFILRVITCVFEKANILEDRKEVDRWEAEDWEHNEKQIVKMQQKFKKAGVGKFITALIRANICDNVQLANEVLSCGIAYLLGGNQESQSDIRKQLQKDPENRVFLNIQNLITKLGSLIRKCVNEDKSPALFENRKDEVIEDFHPTTIDNYDYYVLEERYATRKNVEEPHYTDEAIYYQECIVAYCRAFKFLQLLCENNNIENKNLIKEQPEAAESINFIEICTKELRNLFLILNSDIMSVPAYLLDFILEVTQIPVKPNQEEFIKSSFFEDLCLLDDTFLKPAELKKRGFKDNSELNEIFQKSIQIVLSNFEGNDQNNYRMLDEKLEPQFFVTLLTRKLQKMQVLQPGHPDAEPTVISINSKAEFDDYVERLTEATQNKGKKTAQTTFDDNVTGILELMIIFMKLRDSLGDKSKIYNAYLKKKSSNKGTQELYETLENCLLRIQIADSSNNTQYVYFPNHPVFNSLSEGLKDHVMNEVKRSTHKQKIVSLLGFAPGIKQKIEESYYYEKCENLTEKDMLQSYAKASKLSLFICLYMMMFYSVFIEHGGAEFEAGLWVKAFRMILCLVQLFFSCKYIYIWYKIKIWYKPERVSRKKQDDQQDTQSPKFYQSNDFYKIFLFVMVSFFGTFVHPPLHFIHVMDYICNTDILASIFQAIGQVLKPLLLVSFMGVVFTAIFCTVTFSNYMKNVYEDVPEEEMCEGIISCILALFVSGAISETMEQFEIVRFIFDTIYAIFFGMLFGNIVSGLMLDTFGELRKNTEALNNDKQNKCYICNVSRERIEKHGESFPEHIAHKHYLWNYIFYIIALEKKNATDYTGLQYYISLKYNLPDEEMDVTWIPDGEEVSFDVSEAADKLARMIEEDEERFNRGVEEVEDQVGKLEEMAKQIVRMGD